MFGDVIDVGQPLFFPELMVESPLNRISDHFFEDNLTDAVKEAMRPEPDLVLWPSTWIKHRSRWCPNRRRLTGPQRPTRQHFVILPRLANGAMDSGDHSCSKGIPDSSKDKERNSPSRKQTHSTHSGNSLGFTDCAMDDTGNHCSSTNIGKTREDCPWQFSVDMKGCDEVRATTENGMLMVEGRGSSDTSQQMVRYITSMPRHVSHDSLTASLNNGRLTVSQKAGTQLEGRARTLPIDVQQQELSAEPGQQEQQQPQQSTKKTQHKEKIISSNEAQEKQSCSATKS